MISPLILWPTQLLCLFIPLSRLYCSVLQVGLQAVIVKCSLSMSREEPIPSVYLNLTVRAIKCSLFMNRAHTKCFLKINCSPTHKSWNNCLCRSIHEKDHVSLSWQWQWHIDIARLSLSKWVVFNWTLNHCFSKDQIFQRSPVSTHQIYCDQTVQCIFRDSSQIYYDQISQLMFKETPSPSLIKSR